MTKKNIKIKFRDVFLEKNIPLPATDWKLPKVIETRTKRRKKNA